MIRQLDDATELTSGVRGALQATIHTTHEICPILNSWEWKIEKRFSMYGKPTLVVKLSVFPPKEFGKQVS